MTTFGTAGRGQRSFVRPVSGVETDVIQSSGLSLADRHELKKEVAVKTASS